MFNELPLIITSKRGKAALASQSGGNQRSYLDGTMHGVALQLGSGRVNNRQKRKLFAIVDIGNRIRAAKTSFGVFGVFVPCPRYEQSLHAFICAFPFRANLRYGDIGTML